MITSYFYFDRLEEANCSEIGVSYEYYSIKCDPITSDDLHVVSKDKLIEYYNDLLLVNGDAEYVEEILSIGQTGHYLCYGIKLNENGKKEVVLLHGGGIGYYYIHNNKVANELYSNIMSEFPQWPS